MTDRLASPERIRRAVHVNLIQRVLDYMEEGRTDVWIMDRLGLMPAEFFDMKRRAVRSQVEAINQRSTEEVYAEYVIQQAACIRDLTKMAATAHGKKDTRALIAAVKTRSDIYDKVIKTGQSFGIIEQKAERREIAIGVVLASLSDEDLRGRIHGELTGIKDLMVKFSDQNLLDLNPGKLHRRLPELPVGRTQNVPSLVKPVAGKRSKTNRSRANRVHGGRKVIKK